MAHAKNGLIAGVPVSTRRTTVPWHRAISSFSNEELHGAEVVEAKVAEPSSTPQEKDKPWQTDTREGKRGQRGRKWNRGAGSVMQATSTTTSNSGASSAQVSHKGSKRPTRNHRDPQWLNVKELMHKRPQQNSSNLVILQLTNSSPSIHLRRLLVFYISGAL